MEHGGGLSVIPLVSLAVIVVILASVWKVYTKAGKPGWAALVPLYNLYVLFVIAGKPGWWLVLTFIPLVNIIVWIIAILALSKRFGKGGGFAAGLILLPFIFYPILGFGDSKYST
jgi:hypothetical protein